ncbi:MAG: hypothetical protein Q8O05_04355 [Chloroflexota bacterium]|nr:hypothetical protein [Chloroflexota bacterium]
MGYSEKGVNIQFTDKALTFIKTRRLNNPLVLVNMGFRSGGGGGGGCSGGGGGGGGCGEGESTTSIPYANVVMVDGGNPGADFVKVDTEAGVPVYMAKAAFNRAKRSGNPLFITLKGLVMKKLSLEGLDLTPSADQNSQKEASRHQDPSK